MSVDNFIHMMGHKELSIDDPLYKRYKKAYHYACEETKRELEQAVEGLYHNLNTLG